MIHARGILIKSQRRGMFLYLAHSRSFYFSPFLHFLVWTALLPTHPPPLYLTPCISFSIRELKHRATQQPNEPKFQIHDYIESQKQTSGCCGLK